MTLEHFNARPDAEAALLGCCAAPRWAAQVAGGRPYSSVEDLQDAAAAALTDADLDAAMAGHPRIGDRAAGGTSGREQAAVTRAGEDVRAALAAGNRVYEERFGHVYLVCASGRGAEDLLATLHARLGNDLATERAVALGELAAINRIRLGGLVAGATHDGHRPATSARQDDRP
ncbi:MULTISPECIES: 2-oxo-4-hydroxy-4-carboxy-5-ureidoimidazoline decarboxylase [unclassified Pseudonocardia]|jgi:2-oxo-4-hydroxy-4-carboxy-5-ureidoimidazoline decarboxylase|uniref:2-oxo-4-hydroxy-4-carboxy-5-ureidoimidazoline decarboxylase n=1 Tax=unclassified Pseudonocardia TaxID=2619320 RepID=UPI000963E261|nr:MULTISPECIES: 2-oxo-4-hydroxy-4-carboxy-5-ureidoimidazoline decarboxylase [unclassified Pseudonocardia]MBN9097598.1 2-oxo-4-hydroxy-4-carboxy-5-ureidoimidazoline decarboxylase [Pseudonocardia sp.]OJY39912.1 MAG: OHCU decarboxylase [Pseudonocardia sp. 73-21]